MTRLAATLILINLIGWTTAEAQDIVMTRAGSHPVQQGPADHFTGTARVERLFGAAGWPKATAAMAAVARSLGN